MRNETRSARALEICGALLAALLIGFALWSRPWERRPGASPAPLAPVPVPADERDLALACLASGQVRPPIAELSDAELDTLVVITARLIGAYQRADFDSFLALRAGDGEFAARTHEPLLAELKDLCRQLGVREDELGGGWLAVLERFWRAYYTEAPVARFRPEDTRLELHREGLRGRAEEEWERSFEALCPARGIPSIQHHLMVPHRRDIAEIAADSGPLEWLDLSLDFETHAGSSGRLIARFVRDALEQEWFLHRAVSAGIGSEPAERQLIL